jgi:hypothetical protein
MAQHARNHQQRIMLEHVIETWENIAKTLHDGQ